MTPLRIKEIALKAFVLEGPGKPASVTEIPKPEVGEGGAFVAVRAVSVNAIDAYQASGYLASMMEHLYPTVVGRDFAGVVEAIGAGRTDVAVGDEVLGYVPRQMPLHDGTYAQYVSGASLVLARKPAGLAFEVAAAIPLAGATALDCVDAVAIGPGDTVVVAGATGGVGSIAVQIAVQRGATVIATARPGDEETFVRALGASAVVDYSAGDVVDAIRARYPDGVTALIDMVNREDAFTRMTALVRPGGRVATTLSTADVEALAARDIRATNVMGDPTPEKLASLAAQAAAGTLRVEVQRTFPLAEIQSALSAFGAGTRGKIVITIE